MIIDESYPDVPFIPAMDIVAASRAYHTELDLIDPTTKAWPTIGRVAVGRLTSGILASALVRIADEVCLQMHLLVLSFTLAVRARAKGDAALDRSIRTEQLIGIARWRPSGSTALPAPR